MINPNVNDVYGDVLHAFSFGQNTKPMLAIETLFSALSPAGKPFELEMGAVFHLSPSREEAGIILLENGICSICHSRNNLLITSAFSPSILGLIDGYSTYYEVPARPQHYLYGETHCRGKFVALDDFVSIADEQNLWHDVARILAHRMMVMSAREEEMVGVDSYLKVRTMLIELGSYPEEYRLQIQALSFIQRRTNISRSRVMAILSELRKGQYITIDNGKLTAIHQKLPAAF
nr:winged helix-turn-helix transcriptional regulator [Enterobacter hormaechei]